MDPVAAEIEFGMYGSAAADAHVVVHDATDHNEGQPNVLFKALMGLRNDEKSADILYQHMAQLARTSPAFTTLGYEMVEVKEAADTLVGLGVVTLRQLLDKESVFSGQQPGWAFEEDESTRAVAEFLRGHLALMKEEVMTANPRGSKRRSPASDREDGRGRSRDKHARRHRKSKHSRRSRSDKSSSSSSSSGSHAKLRHNDVVAAFRGSTFTHFGLDLLPSDEIVEGIGKANKKTSTLGVQKVSKKPLEDFVRPPTLGESCRAKKGKRSFKTVEIRPF